MRVSCSSCSIKLNTEAGFSLFWALRMYCLALFLGHEAALPSDIAPSIPEIMGRYLQSLFAGDAQNHWSRNHSCQISME